MSDTKIVVFFSLKKSKTKDFVYILKIWKKTLHEETSYTTIKLENSNGIIDEIFLLVYCVDIY